MLPFHQQKALSFYQTPKKAARESSQFTPVQMLHSSLLVLWGLKKEKLTTLVCLRTQIYWKYLNSYFGPLPLCYCMTPHPLMKLFKTISAECPSSECKKESYHKNTYMYSPRIF